MYIRRRIHFLFATRARKRRVWAIYIFSYYLTWTLGVEDYIHSPEGQ